MCSSCNSTAALSFDVVSENDLLEAARAGHSAKEGWHFHVLAPDCAFNPRPGTYAMVLEQTGRQRRMGCFSDERPVAANKELLAMLHGKDALAKKEEPSGVLNDDAREALEKIALAQNSGRKWHHHMMFPSCAMNPSGKWRIVVEVEGRLVSTLDFDAEPAFLLNRIERLYFGLS